MQKLVKKHNILVKKHNMEFARMYHGKGNNGGGRKKEPPTWYEEALMKSNYSDEIKNFYFKYGYRKIDLSPRDFTKDGKLKSSYKRWLQ